MHKTKRIVALCLSFVIIFSLLSVTALAAPSADPWKSPQQIAVTMTENPQNEMIVTWTTIDLTLDGAKVTVTQDGAGVGGETLTFNAVKTIRDVSNSSQKAENGADVTQKAYYTANITGLSPDTAYNYVCAAADAGGVVYESAGNSFKTAPDDKTTFSFIYLSDTQSSGANGKAISVNSSLWAMYDPDFVYIAGDLTDTAANEGQWEVFFNQKTPGMANADQFSDNYDSAMSDYAIAATQGNHDNNVFAGHLNYPASGGTNITYAYTYGSARFIVLNFENTGSRPAQQAFLREQVAYAKERGLWTIICFHKSIYSGASHMTDSDVVDARLYWSPIFAELDADIVLQGHDHVLSRGFVDAAGNNAGNVQKINERAYLAEKPSNAPLYYVGNCASTLKFYAASAGYTGNTTLAAPDYGFLDINSARAAGHAQNPDGPQTGDFDPLPTYTSVTVSNEAITFLTYMFRYDIDGDMISSEPFLYDSLTLTRSLPDWTSYDAAVADAADFMSNDFGIYTDESIAAALGIIDSVLNANTLETGSFLTDQNDIDEATGAIYAALQEAKAALAVRFIGATPAASVTKLNGNRNNLTITVTELYADGSKHIVAATYSIANNAAGTYEIGGYSVYVDTKGNDKIKACRIIA